MIYQYKDVMFKCDEDIPEEEAKTYIERGLKRYKKLKIVEAHVDGEDIELKYLVDTMPFQRLRRITGYLVGTLDRFNDGKRSEEHDRVKHKVEM